MATIATLTRDLNQLRAQLDSWVENRDWNGKKLKITTLRQFGLASSTESYYMTLGTTGADSILEFAVRIQPQGVTIFREYDLASQAAIMNLLGAHGVPVPHPAHYVDADGPPFVVMPFISGQIPPSTAAPYSVSGWVFDLSRSQQRSFVENFTVALANLHRLDAEAIGFARTVPSKTPGIAGELAWWDDLRAWVAKDMDAETARPAEEFLAWCSRNRPKTEPQYTVIWGDARFGNVIYDEQMGVKSLLDWEMAGIGPAEVDLGWHLAHRYSTASLAGRNGLQDILGAPDKAEQIALYEKHLGRKVQDLAWYELFGAARLTICHLSLRRIFRKTGNEQMKLPPLVPLWAQKAMQDYRN